MIYIFRTFAFCSKWNNSPSCFRCKEFVSLRLQKNEHRALKKMIKEYASLQKSFHHKLIYDPCEISSRETETLTQQI